MNFLASLVSGGILGFVGNLFNQWTKYRLKKITLEHEVKMVQARAEAQVKAAAAQVKIEEEVTRRVVESQEADGFYDALRGASDRTLPSSTINYMLNDKTVMGYICRPFTYILAVLLGFVDVLRSLTRPSVTAGSLLFSGYILFYGFELFMRKGGLTKITHEDLLKMIVMPVIELFLFCASTAVSWWFADRQMSKDYRKGIRARENSTTENTERHGK